MTAIAALPCPGKAAAVAQEVRPCRRLRRNDVLCEARQRFCRSATKSGDEVIEFIWKPNALRHSFASYRMANIKDAARVALEMGNSPTMFFATIARW